MPDAKPVPVWVEAWRDARVNIAILVAALIVLTLIFVFQDRLAQSRLAHRLVRTGFLLFVLVWLGWIAGGQLSIINVMHYAVAPLRGFDASLLLEPLILIIAVYTLVSLAADRPRRVLRLALSVRRAAGTAWRRPRARCACRSGRRPPRSKAVCATANTLPPPCC